MRRRVASPIPPFDTVPPRVVTAAKHAFIARVRAFALRHFIGGGGTGSLEPLRLQDVGSLREQ